MNLQKFITALFLLILFISFFSLFLQEFNFLKISIFLIFILGLLIIFLNYYSKQLEKLEKREKSLSLIEKIFGLINNPICLYDDKMKIFYFNKAFAQFVNLSQEALTDLQVGTWLLNNEIYQNLALVFFPVLIASSVKVKEKNEVEIVEVNFKDELIFELISGKLKIDDQIFNIKIVNDKSIIVKEIKEKSEFLNILAHHLRTPLNQIRWGLESLTKEENISEANKDLIKALYNISSKTLVLAESILWINRIEAGKFKLEIDENYIEEVITSILNLLEIEIKERGLNVKVVIEEDAKKFYFDKKVIFLALYSLIENAVLYNKTNGEININIEKIKERPYIRIIIQDTGIGFSEKDLQHLFEKFYRSKIAKEIYPIGTGLGLYLSKNLIKIHKGEININSKENIGTTLTIELPAQKELII